MYNLLTVKFTLLRCTFLSSDRYSGVTNKRTEYRTFFSSQKSSCFNSLPLRPAPGNHWCNLCQSSFSFSGMSYKWNYTAGSLSRLTSFTKYNVSEHNALRLMHVKSTHWEFYMHALSLFILKTILNYVLFLFPFYRCRNWGLGMLVNLMKVTQLVS